VTIFVADILYDGAPRLTPFSQREEDVLPRKSPRAEKTFGRSHWIACIRSRAGLHFHFSSAHIHGSTKRFRQIRDVHRAHAK